MNLFLKTLGIICFIGLLPITIPFALMVVIAILLIGGVLGMILGFAGTVKQVLEFPFAIFEIAKGRHWKDALDVENLIVCPLLAIGGSAITFGFFSLCKWLGI